MKNIVRTSLKELSVKVSKFACGTASASFLGQPKEPKNFKSILENKK